MTNHGSESTSIYEIKLHGADEDISIADFAPANIIADLDWPKVTADLTFLL